MINSDQIKEAARQQGLSDDDDSPQVAIVCGERGENGIVFGPTIDDVAKLKAEAEIIRRGTAALADVEAFAERLMRGYSVYPIAWRKQGRLFRARVLDKAAAPGNITELGPPPPEITRKFGRANYPLHPLFYAASSAHTAVLESGVRDGDPIVVSHWSNREALQLVPLGFSREVFARATSLRTNPLELADRLTHPAYTASIRLHELLAEIFCDTASHDTQQAYRLSAAIAGHFFTNHDWDGVMYPSVATSMNMDNVALRISSYEKMDLVSVRYGRIIRHAGEFGLRVYDYAKSVSADGTIEWLGTDPEYPDVPPRKLVITLYEAGAGPNYWAARNGI